MIMKKGSASGTATALLSRGSERRLNGNAESAEDQ